VKSATGHLNSIFLLGVFGSILVLISSCATAQSPEIVYPPDARRILSNYQVLSGVRGGIRGSPHTGIDIEADIGEPVLAAADGIVFRADRTAEAEHRILIAHGRDSDGNYVMSVHYHNSQNLVEKDQKVRRGQPIALAGSTGARGFTHFGVFKGPKGGPSNEWRYTDPHEYWVEGPYRITCFDPAKNYPASPIRFTYPLECKRR